MWELLVDNKNTHTDAKIVVEFQFYCCARHVRTFSTPLGAIL